MKLILSLVSTLLVTSAIAQNETLTAYTKTSTNSELGSNTIYSIAVDQNNKKWIGCYHSGAGAIYTFNDTTWGQYTKDDGLINAWVLSTGFDNSGKAWIGTDGGMSTFDGNTWVDYHINGGNSIGYNILPAQDIWDIVIDQQNVVWVASYQGGIAKITDDTVSTIYNTSNSNLPDDNVYGIALDLNNHVWVATKNNGVAKFDGSTWVTYNSSNSALPHNDTKDINVDKNGNIWVACYSNYSSSGGVAMFNGATWTTFNEQNSGLADNTVNCVAVDSNDVIWVGTNFGLSKYDGNSWYTYTTSNSSLPHNSIRTITVDKNNVKWVGSNGGLLKVEDANTVSKLTTLKHLNRIYPNPVQEVLHLAGFQAHVLFDIQGNQILEGNSSSINCKELAAGIYYVLNKENDQIFKILVK